MLVFLTASSAIAERKTISEIKRSSIQNQIDTLAVPEMLFPIDYKRPQLSPTFTSEVQCTVRMVGSSYWAIDSWLAGDEIYKVYQDVDLLGNDCSYPFCVTELIFEMQFLSAGILWVQADIEDIDSLGSTPDCPYPGPVLGITGDQSFEIPGEGYFLIVVPLDEPVIVDGPYFAGCYFGGDTYLLGPSLIADNDPYLCVSWNDWGQGYVDLVSNPYYNFPGNIVMYTRGYNCGGQSESAAVRLYSPFDSSKVAGSVVLYAAELEDTISYEKCSFEYYNIAEWLPIGDDYSSEVTLRGGFGPAAINPGFSVTWNLAGVAEGGYSVRALLYRTPQDFTADTIDLFIDNTPLRPVLTNPQDVDAICDTITLAATIPDEDVSFVQFELRETTDTIVIPLPLLNQFRYGDVDGDTLDLNQHTQGEFGDYYNGPTVMASLLSYFADRGYPALMQSGGVTLSEREMVEAIADSSRVRLNLGSQDDNLLATMNDHIHRQGNQFILETLDECDLNKLLYYMAYRHGVLLLGISEPIGHWLALTELRMPPDGDNLDCMLYDTRGGASIASTLRHTPTMAVEYQGNMRAVDRIVVVHTRVDTTAREVIGGDFNPSDGWSYFWDASVKPEGAYMLSATGIDITGNFGEGTAWFRRECPLSYVKGDADGSGAVDIDDVVYIINYIFGGGPEPIPELAAGDADCSGNIDIDDIVYIINYIFGGGPPPC